LILGPSKKFRQSDHGADVLNDSMETHHDVSNGPPEHSETETETDNDQQGGRKAIDASMLEEQSTLTDQRIRKGIDLSESAELDTVTNDSMMSVSNDDMLVDRAVPEGRIVGSTYPLDDFKNNLSSGDVVTKTVEDLAFIVQEIALRPFAGRRHEELIQCLREMRTVCLREDEVDLWNDSIRELKDVCLSSTAPNNPALWKLIQSVGASLGLITRSEAPGMSSVSDSSASKFLR